MEMPPSPFELIDWTQVPAEEGSPSSRRTRTFSGMNVRVVELAPGHNNEFWCEKGHVIHCLEGEVTIEIQGGGTYLLRAGMTCHVGDCSDPHRGRTTTGAKLFLVD
jgi:quercetin dioxygenase-like cupin family protein